jgi:hypothetical protein
MGTTKMIALAECQRYFDGFTKEHLTSDPPKAVTVEVVSLRPGDQLEARGERLVEVAYDPKGGTFMLVLEDGNQFVWWPTEIWVIEEEGHFVSTVEVVCPDERNEIIYVYLAGPPPPRYPDGYGDGLSALGLIF